MAQKTAIVGNNEGSFEKIACGDEILDAQGNVIGATANGGIGVPIGSLSGQSFKIFDKPIQLFATTESASGNTDISLDLAALSGQPLPDNAVRAIFACHWETLHAVSTTGNKESNIWMDSYPAGGDFTGIDINQNLVGRAFVSDGNANIDVADATIFTAITRSEGSNNVALRLNQPINTQTFRWFWLIGYTLNEEGSTFAGKTFFPHRERLHQSAVVVSPSTNADIGLNLPIPAGLCALPIGITHAWMHHMMKTQFTGTGTATALPRIGPWPAGGNLDVLDYSWFGRSRQNNAPENSSEVASGTTQIALGETWNIGYRMQVNANNQVNERETHVSGYLIDDNPSSVAGLSYIPANGHFLKTGSIGIGATSVTVDLDLKTLLSATPIPANATQAIIRIQIFGEHNTSTQDDTFDTHIDAYPIAGNYSGFATVDNKVSFMLHKLNTNVKLSSGATAMVDLNLADGTNHIGIEFVKTTEAIADYFVFIEGFLLDETTSETANSSKVKINWNAERIGSADTINFTGGGVGSIIETAEGKITINVLGPGSLDYYHAMLAATTGTLSANNTIVTDTLISQSAANGKISQAGGVFTLQPGKYKLSGYIRVGDDSLDWLDAKFWDVTGAAFIGMEASGAPPSSANNFSGQGVAIAYVEVLSVKTYEFRVFSINSNPILFNNGTQVTIEQLPS